MFNSLGLVQTDCDNKLYSYIVYFWSYDKRYKNRIQIVSLKENVISSQMPFTQMPFTQMPFTQMPISFHGLRHCFQFSDVGKSIAFFLTINMQHWLPFDFDNGMIWVKMQKLGIFPGQGNWKKT